jgi:hypothetical protein
MDSTTRKICGAIALLVASASLAAAQPPMTVVPQSRPVVLRATIHTVANGVIENGSIVLIAGEVVAIGQNVEIPRRARLIDLEDMHIYPGLIDTYSSVGITEITVNEGSQHLGTTRSAGVLVVFHAPSRQWLAYDIWGSDDFIPLFDARVLTEHPNIARRLDPKDQFETSEDFTARFVEAQREYLAIAQVQAQAAAAQRERRVAESRKRITLPATAVNLGNFDADRQRFAVTVDGFSVEIEIVPAEARELAQRRTEIIVEAVEQLGPDLATTQRLNLQLVHPTTLKRYPIGPQVALPEVGVVASSPAVLEVSDPRFTDSDGDNRLGAGERALLEFTVRNTGAHCCPQGRSQRLA